MTALSVNLNKVALVRNTRALGIPSVTRLAQIALEAGAGGITVHPRPDGRHIRAHDVRELAALMKPWPACEFNIEGNPVHNLMDFVRTVRPQQCTFVPDETGAFTMPRARLLSEGGRSPYPGLISDPEVGDLVKRMTGGDATDFNMLSKIGRQRKGIKTTWYPEWEQFMMSQVQEALIKKITVKAAITASAAEARRLAKS